MTKRILMLLFGAVLALAALPAAVAQDALANDAAKSKNLAVPTGYATTNACQSTYTFGSGPSYMKFCVTVNGNIAKFESPQGFTQMYAEGYGVCDNTIPSSGYWVDYYDHEYTESGNWATPIIVQPNGPNTFPLKIVRASSDGIWTLTQTFSRNTAEQIVKVVMQLKNNSAGTRKAYVTRYADIDANGSAIYNFADADTDSAWVYSGNGLMLHPLPDSFGFGGNIAQIVKPNSATACSGPPLQSPRQGDSAVKYWWNSTAIASNATKTVSFEYRTM
jgi:hypothetical protein